MTHDDAPLDPNTVRTRIYKGARRTDTYLYVPAADDLTRVPGTLLELMGDLELVMEIDLGPRRQLAKEDAVAVLRNLEQQGFHLQVQSASLDRSAPRRVH